MFGVEFGIGFGACFDVWFGVVVGSFFVFFLLNGDSLLDEATACATEVT